MTWTTRRVSLRVRHLAVAAACLLSLLFFTSRAQAAVERLTLGGVTIDLLAIHDPVDPSDTPTWAWDSESKTLSLDGYNGPDIAFYSSTGNDTVTVVFLGTNAIQSHDGHGLSTNCNLTLRAASMSTQDRLTSRGGGAHGAGIIAQSGVQGKLTIESGVVVAYGANMQGTQDVGGVGIQAQQVTIMEGARAVARGGDGGATGGSGLYTTGLLELGGRSARLDALGGSANSTGGDGIVCAGANMQSPNTAIYTTGGDGVQPGNGLRHTAGYPFDLADGYLTALPGNATTGMETAFGAVTSGNFRISGGTHLITGGIQTPQYGLVISGGSLRTSAADIVDAEGYMAVPTDALGNKVYLTRPAISGGAWAEIDTIYFRRDPPGGYSTTGIVANGVGRLFLWLPSNTAISGVASGLSEHSIEPALVTSEDNGARGTIYAATSEDGQLIALSSDEDGPLAVMSEQGTTIGQLTQLTTSAPASTRTPTATDAPRATATTRATRPTATPRAQVAAPGNAVDNGTTVASAAGQELAQASDLVSATGQPAVVSESGNAAGQPTEVVDMGGFPGQQVASDESNLGSTGTPLPQAAMVTATPAKATVTPKPEVDDKVPPTGDEGPISMLICLLGLAISGLVAIKMMERKKRIV